MRSMWKGAISFGLVMIPVKLYAATEQKDIAFRQVHRDDGGRIRFRRVCSVDGDEVAYEDVAKGYELPDGEMVVLTEEDMADLPLATSKSIEVLNFTPAEQLDPILFNRSYYIEPETAGVRAYALLRDALERSGRVAVAQVALRQRESLATLRVKDGVMVLETLLWPDEVRAADFPFLTDDVEVRSQELRMATSLIDSMTVDFSPDDYHDRYREALQELVAAKTEGRQVMQPPAGEEAGPPTSLADALKASLAAARGDTDEAGETAKASKRGSGGASSRSRPSAARGGRKTGGDGGSSRSPGGSRRTASSGTERGSKSAAGGKDSGGKATDGKATDGKATGGRAAGGRASGGKDEKAGRTQPARTRRPRKQAS